MMLIPLFLFDAPRYAITASAVWLFDSLERLFNLLFGCEREEQFDYCPGITVIVAGLNEGNSIGKGLNRLWGSYPILQIIVVDDGSSDNMSQVANDFAKTHPEVIVITKERGGKSSALNAGLPFAENEIVVILDADSELTETALWEIVQPLQDPKVAAVSGNVLARNKNTNLLTFIQAFEYQRSIFLGRIISSRLGLLGIVSGAFGAFRRDLLLDVGGWDVGPGEDEDLVLRFRKMGYKIEFTPYAECYSDVPTKMKVLTKQRRRWEWAVVTFESRKHIDMANPLHANFQLSNFMLFIERWVFNMLLPICFWLHAGYYVLYQWKPQFAYILSCFYVIFVALEFLQYLILLDYSNNKRRDVSLILVVPIMPFYQLYQRTVTTWAILEEIIHRRSFKDGFVPEHVRKVTWHW